MRHFQNVILCILRHSIGILYILFNVIQKLPMGDYRNSLRVIDCSLPRVVTRSFHSTQLPFDAASIRSMRSFHSMDAQRFHSTQFHYGRPFFRTFAFFIATYVVVRFDSIPLRKAFLRAFAFSFLRTPWYEQSLRTDAELGSYRV